MQRWRDEVITNLGGEPGPSFVYNPEESLLPAGAGGHDSNLSIPDSEEDPSAGRPAAPMPTPGPSLAAAPGGDPRGGRLPAIVIIGNKIDLESQREVSTAEAEAYAKFIGCTYLETSARTGENVLLCFETLVRSIPHEQEAPPAQPSVNLADESAEAKRGFCC
ncbi:hypothetical protein H696_04477 [Fonticula alba]|uniref:Rab family, other n=1 Tax=Fonticula alba TaxID=691883 RepID=A0A058Z564_FONAL|nr:hypothetical protein H696_04477 [Fonticula alba]KCV69058.1 hypothetical protein H696_04477 [Fonticula alba]|eukprot:XP_009496629.1 hypothetical protein H696_04477 [Fonticula alba]